MEYEKVSYKIEVACPSISWGPMISYEIDRNRNKTAVSDAVYCRQCLLQWRNSYTSYWGYVSYFLNQSWMSSSSNR